MSKTHLEIYNNTRYNLNHQQIKKIIDDLIKLHLPESQNLELTIYFVGSGKIKKINNQYRKINHPTDVLSFPINMFNNTNLPVSNLGDIIVCPVYAKSIIPKNITDKTQYAKLLDHEIINLIEHGFLHLIGIHHD